LNNPATDKRIYYFHVEDGSRTWEFETEDKIWSSPSLSEYDGKLTTQQTEI